MRRWALFALLSHWRRAPLQLVAIVLGLALATALWSAVQAINATARSSYAEAESQIGLFGTDRIISQTGTLNTQDYIALRRSGWLVSPVWESNIKLGSSNQRVMVIDVLSHPMVETLLTDQQSDTSNASAGAILSELPLFAHPNTLTAFAEEFPTAAAPHLPVGLVVTDFAVAQDLFGEMTDLSYLVVLAENSKIRDALPEHLTWIAGTNTSPGQLTDSFHLNLTAFGLLAFVVGLFIVQSTVKLAVEQRRTLMRTLRSLGLPLPSLLTLCAMELMCLALIAGGLGLFLGYFFAGVLLPGVNATLSGLYGADVTGGLQLQPQWILSGLFMTTLGTLMAGGGSLLQIYKLPILQSPATSARGIVYERGRKQTLWIGLILIVCAPLCLAVPHLIAGFALMAALMLGAVLLLPTALSYVIRFSERRAKPGLGQWIWSDMRGQLGMLSVPMMALALAVAANIGVETMTSSFRITFVDWINQRFSADLYITIENPEQAPEILDFLSDQDLSARPLTTMDWSDAPHPTHLWGIVDDPYYAQAWPMVAQTANAWDKLHRGDGVMINEQMARARQIWPDDEITLPIVGPVTVLGAYPDYGNPNHQVMMAESVLKRISSNAPTTNIAITTNDKSRIRNTLLDQKILSETSILDQNTLREQSLRIFDQTFLVTAALNVLTLAVAGFALLTSFAALWNQRLPQLAPLWAMGLPLPQIAKLEVLRSLGLALLVALFAIPLGLVLAWILLSVTNVLAFGWKLPLYLSPLSWARTVFFALLAAFLACAPSAIRLYRTAPSELLKVFSSER